MFDNLNFLSQYPNLIRYQIFGHFEVSLEFVSHFSIIWWFRLTAIKMLPWLRRPIISTWTSLTWAPSTTRFFSCGVNHWSLSKDPAKRRQQLDRQNELRRLRYATRPEVRKRVLEQNACWTRKNRPPGSPYYNKYLKKNLEAFKKKYHGDAEFRKQHSERMKDLKRNARLNDPGLLLKQRIYDWCRHHPWFCELLPWKTHEPCLFDTKVTKRCASCGIARQNGLRLWWRSISEPESFNCNICQLKNPTEALPSGYEGLTTLEQIRERLKELDPESASELEAKATASAKKGKR